MTKHTSTRTSTLLHDLVSSTFATLEAKDLEAIMSLFAEDAVLSDPHIPTPRMEGKAAIRQLVSAAAVLAVPLKLKYWCIKAIAMLPSPTLAAQRFTEPDRTS